MKMHTLFIFISILIILSFFIFSGFISLKKSIKIGDEAPLFNLYDQNGELFSLNEYKGKKIVIYFFPRTFTPG